MSDNTRLKRLQYRSLHRGCKETDFVLGNFARNALAGLDPKQVELYEQLLNEDDADIWDWLTGKAAPSNAGYLPLLEMMRRLASAA